MKIIPVLDLMHGQAVHARHGRREHYRPLQSLLCRSAEPQAVVDGLLGLQPFDTIYVADLDALMGKSRQSAVLSRLMRTFPGIRFWVDQGLPDSREWPFFEAEDNAVMVVGSESFSEQSLPLLTDRRASFILSLDFRDGEWLGPDQLPKRPELWPETVILMNLTQVGGTDGPDFGRAKRFKARYPHHRFVAAGGVRGESDLERLAAMGMDAVLMASALHSGAVDARVLGRFG
jgi:phosphoribosylformimino-5-aminoimidazole carboxamide ribotide isomerase